MYKPCGFGTALEKAKETHNPVQAPRNAKAFRLPSLKFKHEEGAVAKPEAEAKPEPEAGTVTAAEVVSAAVVETIVETPNAAKAVPKPSRLAQALHNVIEAAAEAEAADAAKDVIDKLRRTRKPNKMSENKMWELTKEVESNAEIETTKVETTKVETTVMPRHSVRMTYTVPAKSVLQVHVRRVRPSQLTTPKPTSPEVVPVPPPEKEPETKAPRAMTPRMKFMLAMETPPVEKRQASPPRITELVSHNQNERVYRVWTRK
jgi:hypothetical protein